MGGARSWTTIRDSRINVINYGSGSDGRCPCGGDGGARNGITRWHASDSDSDSNRDNNVSNGGGSNGSRSGGMLVYDSLSMSHKPLHLVDDSLSTSSSCPSSTSQFATARRGVAWYICGPTVYDSAHVGHGRTYVTLDIMRRVAMHYYSYDGPGLLYVMNITDVDDKIIKRSAITTSPSSQSSETSQSPAATTPNPAPWDPIALARYYESEFWSDMDQLNVLRPNVICRVSEHVESTIVPYVSQILEGGMAYVVHEDEGEEIESDSRQSSFGSVYFDVRAFESKANGRTRYGKLAPDIIISTTTTSTSSNGTFFSWEKSDGVSGEIYGDNDDTPMVQRVKRDPRDFCLWKYRPRRRGTPKKPPSSSTTTLPNNDDADNDDDIIEPETVSYNSPWGPGRPGWHVECSAMIHRLSQDFHDTHVFAMHAGGIDLRFPHHTNEIAQAEAHSLTGGGGEQSSSDGTNNDDRTREWIPHWLHTGHLHVKGRKMSKSLKNFITIREMLQLSNDQNEHSGDHNNAWHSPSDDFRLWCLGLSGSYRGPATYGKDRLEEARTVREKWVRFLIEGQECLDKWMEESRSSSFNCGGDPTMANNDINASYSSTRLWKAEDLSLFRSVAKAKVKCQSALMEDLDGATFVRELTDIAETGLAYVRQAMHDEENQSTNGWLRLRPEEPLRFVLEFVRSQLDLVGFTPRTVSPGLGVATPTKISPSILDETVAFRAAVRSTALNAIRRKEARGNFDAIKDILGLCDELRDDIFPKYGFEIIDGKVAVKETGALGSKRGWRHCPPRGST